MPPSPKSNSGLGRKLTKNEVAHVVHQNREQFYVSISRGRERVHVFTDDAELLAQGVTDSHERKAAGELQTLRDDLAKLGFVRREQSGPKIEPPNARQDLKMIRTTRATRMAPAQRLAQIIADTRRWVNERLGLEQSEAVAEKIEQVEKISPDLKESPEQRATHPQDAHQNTKKTKI